VGGSAGGLDAYTRLLRHLPADMGVAIVIVNHLRIVATQLHEILPRCTEMPVELITEGLLIQPNGVFIIPAQRDLHVFDGEFRLKPISKPRGSKSFRSGVPLYALRRRCQVGMRSKSTTAPRSRSILWNPLAMRRRFTKTQSAVSA